MNNDLISREAAVAVCSAEYKECLRKSDWSGDSVAWNIGFQLKQLPAVDAVEVVHAEWIWDGYEDRLACSHCGAEAHYTSTFKETFDYDWEENLQSTGYEELREYIRTDYCPNCGARMDLDGE